MIYSRFDSMTFLRASISRVLFLIWRKWVFAHADCGIVKKRTGGRGLRRFVFLALSFRPRVIVLEHLHRVVRLCLIYMRREVAAWGRATGPRRALPSNLKEKVLIKLVSVSVTLNCCCLGLANQKLLGNSFSTAREHALAQAIVQLFWMQQLLRIFCCISER